MPMSWSSSQLQQQLPGFDFPRVARVMQFPVQLQLERLMPLLSRSVPASPQRPCSPQVVLPQQQLLPNALLLGQEQAQPNQAALPVYGP